MRTGGDLVRAVARNARWLVVVVAVVGIAGAANAAGATKLFDATVSPVGTVAAGGTAEFELTLANDSTSTHSLGAANFYVPAGWSLDGVEQSSVTSDGGRTWAIGTDDDVDAFTFRAVANDDALEPGDFVTATVQSTVPCTAGSATWTTEVKQANSFSGPPGNDFQPSDLDLGVTVGSGGGAPAELEFTTQPADAVETGEQFGVTVRVIDSCGATAAGATGSVDVDLVQPDDLDFGGSGTLGGTDTQSVAGTGIATFTDLTVSAAGQGYSLDATYSGTDGTVGPEPSEPFDVFDGVFTDCSNGCSHSDDTTTIALGPVSGPASLSLKANSTASCNGLNVLGSAFTIIPPPGHTAFDIPVTLTIDKPALQGLGVSNIKVCKNEGPGTDLVTLGKCPRKGAPSGPCILSQTSTNAGDAVIRMLINSTDPGGAGFG